MGTNSGRNCFHIRRLGWLYRQLFVEGDRLFPHMMAQLNSWAVIDWQYMSAVKQWHQKQFHENFTSAFSLWFDVASDRLWFQGKRRTTAQFPLPLFFVFSNFGFSYRAGTTCCCELYASTLTQNHWTHVDFTSTLSAGSSPPILTQDQSLRATKQLGRNYVSWGPAEL